MAAVVSIDPRTGQAVEEVAQETTTAEVDHLCTAALAAAPGLEALGRAGRAALLRTLADALEDRREDIVAVADRETALGPARLNGELTRTCYQLRAVRRGPGRRAATSRRRSTTPTATRRWARGPTCAGCWSRSARSPSSAPATSRWPSPSPGGDTASALAAGCPVVVKAHASHPARRSWCGILRGRGRGPACPPARSASCTALRAGADLVATRRSRPSGFTGSVRGGRALFDVVEPRPGPIPFFGELGSLNPVVVITAAAAAARGPTRSAPGSSASFTLGAGQFCTKPGLVVRPGRRRRRRRGRRHGRGGARDRPRRCCSTRASPARTAASPRGLADAPGVEVLARGAEPAADGFRRRAAAAGDVGAPTCRTRSPRSASGR